MLIQGLEQGKRFARDAAKAGKTIGTVHTLGALHEGHAELIKRASAENDVAIVTVYPNKIQLLPGAIYQYNLNDDVELAMQSGATAVISTSDSEMFDENYSTYVWQEQIKEIEGVKGQVAFSLWSAAVTGAIRWINLIKPNRSYFGLKDIEQALIMRRAVKDLFIDCEIHFVPTVRFKTGVPLSSRIRKLGTAEREELASLYRALEHARELVAQGEKSASVVFEKSKQILEFNKFELVRFMLFSAETLKPMTEFKVPFVIAATAKSEGVTAFDNLYVASERDLKNGPESIWLDQVNRS